MKSVVLKKNCFVYARRIISLRPIEIRTQKITTQSIYNLGSVQPPAPPAFICYLKLTAADLHFNTPSVPRLWEANAPSLRRQRHYVTMLLELFNNSAKRTTTRDYLAPPGTK